MFDVPAWNKIYDAKYVNSKAAKCNNKKNKERTTTRPGWPGLARLPPTTEELNGPVVVDATRDATKKKEKERYVHRTAPHATFFVVFMRRFDFWVLLILVPASTKNMPLPVS